MQNKLFFRCKKCLLPSTKPDLHFDTNGICMACKYMKHYKNVNWEKRKQDFFDLFEKMKKKNNPNNYDCTIAVSGGKDSTYQTYLITKEVGLKPLLLSFEPSYPTELGKANLKNLVDTFGCDLIHLKKSPTYRKLAKICFDVVGDHEWPNHVGIFCWPIQMANKLNIPITFYAEPRGLIGLGRWETFMGKRKNEEQMKEIIKSDVDQYVGMNGYRLNDIMEYDKSIKPKDVIPYVYPSKKELKTNIKCLNLGYFFQWDFEKNIEIIKKYGWKSSNTNTEGTFTKYEDLDCGFMAMHQYFKFVKYGYGRGTDHAAYEIRHGRMTKKQAKELIIEFDGKLPRKHFKEFLEFLNITEDYFFKTRDRFTNPWLFKKNENNNYVRGNDDNLFLQKLWFESFEV